MLREIGRVREIRRVREIYRDTKRKGAEAEREKVKENCSARQIYR